MVGHQEGECHTATLSSVRKRLARTSLGGREARFHLIRRGGEVSGQKCQRPARLGLVHVKGK